MKILIGFVCGVVVTVLCLLALPVLTNAGLQPSCPKCQNARYDISSISTALNIYGFDNGAYPSDKKDLKIILENDLLKRLPKDPWGRSYQYASYNTEKHTCFIVWSFGSDGKPGGKKEHEQDIYNSSTAGNCITKQGIGRG